MTRTVVLLLTVALFGSGLLALGVTVARCGWQTAAYVGSPLWPDAARAAWLRQVWTAPCPAPPHVSDSH